MAYVIFGSWRQTENSVNVNSFIYALVMHAEKFIHF